MLDIVTDKYEHFIFATLFVLLKECVVAKIHPEWWQKLSIHMNENRYYVMSPMMVYKQTKWIMHAIYLYDDNRKTSRIEFPNVNCSWNTLEYALWTLSELFDYFFLLRIFLFTFQSYGFKFHFSPHRLWIGLLLTTEI